MTGKRLLVVICCDLLWPEREAWLARWFGPKYKLWTGFRSGSKRKIGTAMYGSLEACIGAWKGYPLSLQV